MDFSVGNIVEGTVTGITKFGAFVALPGDITGLVHISEVSQDFVKDIHTVLSVGDSVKVKVLKSDDEKKISLSIKKAVEPKPRKESEKSNGVLGFEDMMKRFMQDSNERQGEVRRHNEGKKGSR